MSRPGARPAATFAALTVAVLLGGCGSPTATATLPPGNATASATTTPAPNSGSSATSGTAAPTGTGTVPSGSGTATTSGPSGSGTAGAPNAAPHAFGETANVAGLLITVATPTSQKLAKAQGGATTYQLIPISVRNNEGDDPFYPDHVKVLAVDRSGKGVTAVTGDPALVAPGTAAVPLGSTASWKVGFLADSAKTIAVGVFYDNDLLATFLASPGASTPSAGAA